MRTSLRFVYNKQRISDSGWATIYIRIVINRQKKDIAMPVRWPVKYFNLKAGICKPRFTDDGECEDNNMILRREMSKCNDILRYYRIADLPVTLSRFLQDYRNNLSKSDFVEYMRGKILQRYHEKEISYETYLKHLATLRKLESYNNKVLFADLDENWAQNFDNWMKRNIKGQKVKLSQNTRWGHHKVIKTYLHRAVRDHIQFSDPYQWFSLGAVRGSWEAIFEEDVKKLYEFYYNDQCKPVYRPILRAFLFACMTGLRISDLKRITTGNIMDGMLVFVPQKTQKQNKLQKIPLNKMALQMLDDAMKIQDKDTLFQIGAEQYANRKLKEIAQLAGINKNLHWHIARHTFISLYYAKSKDLLATKEFAGHASIKQTMVYTHQNPQEIKDRMKPMDDII